MLTKTTSATLVIFAVFILAAGAASQNQPQSGKFAPKLEPIADTKLLMEGLLHPNFRGLGRLLNQKDLDAQGWAFARGQALLIAEGANLLMLRPPKKEGQQAWFERSMELRSLASQLAQVMSRKEQERGRSGLQTLASSCNRCHQTFRVQVQVTPFEAEPPAKSSEL